MNTLSFAAVLDDLEEADLHSRDGRETLSFLARSIRRHTGVDRVLLYCVGIVDGRSEPRLGTKVVCGGDPESPVADRVEDLRFFGRAAIGNSTVESTEVVRGPAGETELPLLSGQQCLVVRCTVAAHACWALVISGQGKYDAEASAAWASALAVLLKHVLKDQNLAGRMAIRKRQQEFYRFLLDYVPQDPTDDFAYICRAWQQVADADWAWLWLYNPASDTFELTAAHARVPEDSVIPDQRDTPGKTSIGTYCVRTGKSVYVDDPRGWRAVLDGQEYRVVIADSLLQMGCRAFCSVPLLRAGETDAAQRSSILGAVSLHWRDASRRIPHPQAAVRNMRRLTALSIRDSQMTQQRAILVELNRIAQRFLAQPTRRPSDVRSEYLKFLIRLIRDRLHVGQVSIFFRAPYGNAVQCIASTGLCRSNGERIPDDALSSVSYKPYEGLTGCCFASGEPITSIRPTRDLRFSGTYREVREVEPGLDEDDPISLTPIPAPRDGRPESKQALGVIRCIEHRSIIFDDALCHFFPTELETLGFIAEQIGPVLQTFEQRIEREQSISVVRHELAAPLSMIRDAIHDITMAVDSNMPLGEHDLDHIVSCNYVAINLVKQLDADPRSLEKPDKQPCKLEGDIVARLTKMLRRYAWVAAGMKIQFDGFRDIPKLFLDRAQVERAICNLLLNAVKYGERNSTIDIKASRSPSGYRVDVSNFGMGVLPGEKDYIFESGFRTERAAQRAPGLGLGLAITRQVMRAHGGDVRLTALENPTTFSLYFPKSLENVS